MFGINRVTRRALKLSRLDDAAGQPPARRPQPEGSRPISRCCAEVGERITDAPLTAGNAIDDPGGRRCRPIPTCWRRSAAPDIRIAHGVLHLPRRRGGPGIRRRPDRGRRRAASRCACCWTVSASAIFFPRIYHRMRRGGVTAARFLHTWLPWRMPFLNMRNHRKLLVVDGSAGLHGRDEYRRGELPLASSGTRLCRRHPFPRRRAGGAAGDGRLRPRLDLHHRGNAGRGYLVAGAGSRRARSLRAGCARAPTPTSTRSRSDPGRGAQPGAKAHPHRHALFPARSSGCNSPSPRRCCAACRSRSCCPRTSRPV